MQSVFHACIRLSCISIALKNGWKLRLEILHETFETLGNVCLESVRL